MLTKLFDRPKLAAKILFLMFYLDFCAAIVSYGRGSHSFSYPGIVDMTHSVRSVGGSNTEPVRNKTASSALENNAVLSADPTPDVQEIDGPGQPEMSTFRAAGTSDMVDLFSGDFSYNIPLLDVGGYPVNIHYASGVSMDQEASWVGLGWNINPGTIGRSLRGIPDDFNGTDEITRVQNIRDNRTVGVTVEGNVEALGFPLNIGARRGIFYNTYKGWGIESGLNASINSGQQAKGPLSGSLGITNNSQTGLDVNPSISVRIGKADAFLNGNATIGSNYNSRAGISGLQLSTEVRKNVGSKYNNRSIGTGLNSYMSFATPSYTPTITIPITNKQYSFTAKVGGEAWGMHANLFIEGYVSKQGINAKDREQKIPAFGYLHFSKSRGTESLLDFNREKDVPFNIKSTPHIAIPQYTYDLYTISGEGTGGMFRPYRGDIGFIHDHKVRTRSENDRASGDFGAGSLLHVGVDFSNTTAITTTDLWTAQNDILNQVRFGNQDSTFEDVYFRNPAEKSINPTSFYTKIGGDSLVRIALSGSGEGVKAASAFTRFSNARPDQTVNVNSPIRRSARDKRTQVIYQLTANEAKEVGLDRQIYSYKAGTNHIINCENAIDTLERVAGDLRRSHHMSEIRILNADGRRYVYGLPAYNKVQEEVTFAVAKEASSENLDKGLVSYSSGDNGTGNSKGKDHYFNKDITPSYAHSFLLTGLLSPDYVDITGNGITEDDLGDGIKFNYTQVYGEQNGYYKWRTPSELNKANYNEGLKTYNRDDKGTYIYGEKEVWYLHSLESKTMIAVFKISNRNDAMSVLGENGGWDTGKKLKRLDSIQLFVKSDLALNGNNARPLKTVHFEYNYELCQGVTGSGSDGKLTLKKIWFTYNGNNKGQMNPYQFRYNPGTDGNTPAAAGNPSYNAKTYDRWGNYKNPETNPADLNNIDFPYTIQDSTVSARNTSVWHLTDIRLPSGGRLKVTYESDDYSFVQDKRAAQMVTITGFSDSESGAIQNNLYNSSSRTEYEYVFFQSPVSLQSKQDLWERYLEGIHKVYFKLAVKMPADQWGSGHEFVPTYGEIEDYGVLSGNQNAFWIKLKKNGGRSPLAQAAIQFLRLNLPSKAYPGSEIGDDFDLGAAVKMLVSGFREILNAVDGFDDQAKKKGWCRETIAQTSFARLNNPFHKKYGGGNRVKKIELFDNWTAMTKRESNDGMRESVYGQEYVYETTRELNGKTIVMSSGVATYEPMIGAEENPFREPIEYIEKVAPLAPADNVYTELPLGESYFPSPSVGYSKIRVRTINAKAKSANGWQETRFYTSRDFPTKFEFTPLDGDSRRRHNPKLRNFLRINAKHYVTVSQGFKVSLNDMNGKMRSQAFYPENDPFNAVSYTENYYKTESDRSVVQRLSNEVWTMDSANGVINKHGQIGKEVELMVDFRQQVSTTSSASVSGNIDIIPAFPFVIPFPSKVNLPQFEENRFRSASVLKIVQQYGILDSVVVMQKGSIVTTKNLVYDGETGNVLLSRTNNEFEDPVYSFNYPAHWAYSGMSLAYQNINLVLRNKQFVDGVMLVGNQQVDPQTRFFESGDEIYVTGRVRTGVGMPANGNDCPENMFATTVTSQRIWAIDAAIGKQKHRGTYFVDANGVPYSAIDVSLRIIRSGKRNMTDASVGSVVSLADPIREVATGRFKIVFDTISKVLNTSAMVYADTWKIENSYYEADSCYTVYRNAYNKIFYPTHQAANFRDIYIRKSHIPTPPGNRYSNQFAASSDKRNIGSRNNHIRYNVRSAIRFDLTSIPPSSTIQQATLYLQGGAPRDIWQGVNEPRLSNFPSKLYAHYQSGGDDLNDQTNASLIKEINGPWSVSGTNYHALPMSNTLASLGSFAHESCTNTSTTLTSYVQKIVTTPSLNYGIAIDLESQTTGNREDHSSERTVSFCAPDAHAAAFSAFATPLGCTSCSTPAYLSINYSYYKDTCVKVCRTYINDTASNPYRWGLLGNWRLERSYVYYHEREQSDASLTTTNVRREGELKDFLPFWNFGAGKISATSDSSRWVWNQVTSKFNRKGFEIENYDALGRFNSALYGYNQTLPIAVAQNAKSREILFDGFEDYGFKTQYCEEPCQSPREIDFLKNSPNASRVQTVSHSGRYSLFVNPASTANFSVSLVTPEIDTVATRFGMQVDSTPVYITTVNGKGTGLTATYSCAIMGTGTSPTVRKEGPVNFDYDNVTGLPTCSPFSVFNYYGATWTGKLQAPYTDDYTFSISSGATQAGLSINGTIIIPVGNNGGTRTSSTVRLVAGQLYNITVTYPLFMKRTGEIQLKWSSLRHHSSQIIPIEYLYPSNMTTADTVGSVRRDIQYYCVALNNIKTENPIRPYFSPLRGSKLLVSGWINTNPDQCISTVSTPVSTASVSVNFNTGTPLSVTMQPTGVPIEGWQRVEAVVNVPSAATTMSVRLNGDGEFGSYFDDIRVQPYHSALKSYVYDPISLRLMAILDENNYASFYEYDDDGTLIRTKKETVRGIQTITETRSALYKEN